ncbi:MAG TPA: anhydro-N-acetylmuramic acid kinase [Thermoflexia bacterium]|nr:anhydro-N-acetylmuramic acid kinase [Thermoflexia bacterium]
MLVVGLMSGTSADGTEAVVIRITGAPPALQWKLLAHTQLPHPPALREEIFACFRPETGTVDRLAALNFALGRAFAQAALNAIAAAGLEPRQIELIGSHGQTLWHIPTGPQAATLQLGAPSVIAELTGVPVISDFRARDMAAGGEGAPLVAYVDQLLLTDKQRVRAAQNLGGIANVTYLPPAGEGEAFAFDTGPGNMLLDYAAGRATQGAWVYDHAGELAAQGEISPRLLAELLAHPYLRQTPPKTTGRERFGVQFGTKVWERARRRGLSPVDILATLTAFTARSIARAYADFLPRNPDEVIVSGGGVRNRTLLRMLRDALPQAEVWLSDAYGLPAEAKEAIAFAVLAYESWHRRPGNLPAATGARAPVILGSLTPGQPVSSVAATRATESRNPATRNIDQVSTRELVRLMNAEDRLVAEAVSTQNDVIASAIDQIVARMRQGGRLIYLGAGTSGRLGVLDASECPPTFNTTPERVVGLIAGGETALTTAVEGAEDDAEAGAQELAALDVTALDSVVGIASSGRTPYVLGGLREARRRGALTIGLTCNQETPLHELAALTIAPNVGPEVLTGSTRLKAGTAQKLVLNMLSTGVMIRWGKTYGNLMVDVQPTNSKLRARARHIVTQATGVSEEEAAVALTAAAGEVKTAIVALRMDITPAEARQRLDKAGGVVRRALGSERASAGAEKREAGA